MLKKYLILFLILIFTFVSCGEEGTSEEEFNTTDYVYVMINISKYAATPNRDKELFKVNGKTQSELQGNLDFVKSRLEEQGYPYYRDTRPLTPYEEIFTLKIKAKDIREISDSLKIKVTANEAGYLTTPFEYTGVGHEQWRCGTVDIQKEADFPFIKLVHIELYYNYYEDDPSRNGIKILEFMYDKLHGNPEIQGGLGCAGGWGVKFIDE